MGVMKLKPKKKPQGIRNSGSNLVNESQIEKNVRNEIAKEIKPKTNK